MTTYNETTLSVINLVATGTTTLKEIADKLDIKLIAVVNVLNQLKKNELAVYVDKQIVLTEQGKALVEPVVEQVVEPVVIQQQLGEIKLLTYVAPVVKRRTGTKMARAFEIIEQMQKEPRKAIACALAEQLEFSIDCANMYIQHYRREHGLVGNK